MIRISGEELSLEEDVAEDVVDGLTWAVENERKDDEDEKDKDDDDDADCVEERDL